MDVEMIDIQSEKGLKPKMEKGYFPISNDVETQLISLEVSESSKPKVDKELEDLSDLNFEDNTTKVTLCHMDQVVNDGVADKKTNELINKKQELNQESPLSQVLNDDELSMRIQALFDGSDEMKKILAQPGYAETRYPPAGSLGQESIWYGRVAIVLIEAGDKVEAGQDLFVLNLKDKHCNPPLDVDSDTEIYTATMRRPLPAESVGSEEALSEDKDIVINDDAFCNVYEDEHATDTDVVHKDKEDIVINDDAVCDVYEDEHATDTDVVHKDKDDSDDSFDGDAFVAMLQADEDLDNARSYSEDDISSGSDTLSTFPSPEFISKSAKEKALVSEDFYNINGENPNRKVIWPYVIVPSYQSCLVTKVLVKEGMKVKPLRPLFFYEKLEE